MTEMIDAGTNPDQANAMLAGALQETPSSVPASKRPTITPPPDRTVHLMAGIVNQLEGTTQTVAVVRELTGADEEALTSPSLARNPAKYIALVAVRGTESIGGEKATAEIVGDLLVGDRELLLLGIRKATYGNEMELITRCPHCDDRDEDYVFDLSTVDIKPLESLEDAIYGFDVELPSGGTARVSLARASDQDAVLGAGETKGMGELNTLMLSRCVTQLNEVPVMGPGVLKNLGIRDRQAILKAINEKTPGPRLGEAKRTCRACEQEFDLNLGLLDLFRA